MDLAGVGVTTGGGCACEGRSWTVTTGAAYFLARITIDPGERDKLEGGELYPGMPAEVMIVTGEQTAFDYLLSPVTDSFRRAFRED